MQQDECIKLLDYLKLVAPATSDGRLDVVTIRVLLALLASFNCNVMDSAIENSDDEQCKYINVLLVIHLITWINFMYLYL